jgi:hypothetical protein
MSPQTTCIPRTSAPSASSLIVAQHQTQLQAQTSADCNASVARMRRGMQRIRTAQAQERRSCSFLFLY